MNAFSADLSGSAFAVTGASSGIGAHASALLARSGARVALMARRRERLEALAAEIRGAGGTCAVCPCDVTDEASLEEAFTLAQTSIGPLGGLINNAGIGRGGPAIDADRADWEAVIATNLSAPFYVAQRFAKGVAAGGKGGTIVNIASIAGLRPGNGMAAYGASKAGLVYLTSLLALEWGRFNIRVNAIAPGYIRTDLNAEFLDKAGEEIAKRIPLRRIGRLDDLDGALLFYASAASSNVTGTVLPVDGGHLVASL